MSQTAFPSGAPQPRPQTSDLPAPERVAPYLRVPDQLLRSFAHDPLAVGVYLAVARCAVAQQGPVPLSPADLAAWSGHAHARHLGLMRRLKVLIAAGWLVAARPGAAVKQSFCPTWGRDAAGTPRPWRWEAAQLGKPVALRARRVPTELLDTYLGRLDPQPGRRPAPITRYFDRPLLDLLDIGVYALCNLVVAVPTQRLAALDLVSEGAPLPPGPVDDLLAQAAHGALLADADDGLAQVRLTPAGWRKLSTERPRAGRPEANGSPSGSRNGSPSGSPNGSCRPGGDPPASGASGRQEIAAAGDDAANTWESWESWKESWIPPTPHVATPPTGGGGWDPPGDTNQSEPATPAGDDHAADRCETAERADLLRAMGIRHHQGLTDAPIALIRAWSTTLQHPGLLARITDPAAFAYSQLRSHAAPPDPDVLDRWAQHCGAPEHCPPIVPSDQPGAERYARRVAQARALAPDPGDDALVAAILLGLEQGLEAESALAAAQATLVPAQPSEEVYRGLRARAAR